MSVCINVKINVEFLVVEDIYHFLNHFFRLYFFVTVTSAQISILDDDYYKDAGRDKGLNYDGRNIL